MKILENTQEIFNCLQKHPSFYCVASSHVKKLCREQHADAVSQRSKCRRCSGFVSSVCQTAGKMSPACSPLGVDENINNVRSRKMRAK